MIKDAEYIFITDIGSTTTKGLLIKYDERNDRYNFVAQADSYTTVEKPFEDVNIGVRNAVKKIEKLCGIRILDQHNRFEIPYLTTSSAGGGLQILVCGLTSVDTGKNAEITALGAGGLVLRTFTIDDGLKDFERIKVIIDLSPDMILVAGGYDGGFNMAILRFVQLMILASPTNRFDRQVKIPLIYCGDTNMQKYINSMLPGHFIVSCTENIRPDYNIFNYEPAKQKIHEVFKNSVMEHAPGYRFLKDLTSIDIKPTPTAVEQVLKLYVEKHNENIIAIDMGGATTDIYSYIKGSFHRTVSANVGLSFSMANILATVLKNKNIKELTDSLPPSYSEDNIRNYINNKTLNPSYLPISDPERYLEQICAVLGFELSLNQHLDMNFNNLRNDFFDRIDSLVATFLKKFGKKLHHKHEYCEDEYSIDYKNKFCLSDIQTIIGSGGVVAYAQSREEQIYMLTEGLKPHGITKIVIDKPFKVSHMGILSFIDPKSALEMFERECLETIAYVIAPTGKIKPNKPVIHLKEKVTGKTFVLTGGQIIYSPGGGDFEITSANGYIKVDRTLSFYKIKTDLPILIDCRGREKYFIKNPLIKSGIAEFKFKYGIFASNIPLNQIDCSKISYELREFTGSLPHYGNIIVQKGEYVKAGDVIGKNESAAQEYFYVDYNHLLDVKNGYPVSDIKKRMKVKIGQFVKTGDVLFRGISFENENAPADIDYIAQRSGTVAGIYYDVGLIAFEILEKNEKVELEAAKFFGQKNKYVSLYLDVHEDEPVRENQIIGMKIGRYPKILKSPIKGIIKRIDKNSGTVVIENIVTPYLLKAFVSGKVKSVEDGKSVTVEAKCAVVNGATGFGGETHGKVYFVENTERFVKNKNQPALEGKILVFHERINLDLLHSATMLKVNGIIAPSINNKDWVLFCKNELNVAFTGDEQFGFSLVLIKGFGNYRLEDDIALILKSYQDMEISITGRTQIRAGIIRPQIILPAPV